MMDSASKHGDPVTRAEFPAKWRALADRVIAEYRDTLGGDLLAVACFGSVVRGKPSSESDLDLYVVTHGEVTNPVDQRLDLLGRIRSSPEYQTLLREGYHPDPMPIFHTATKLTTHPWILLDIVDHGVILFDPEGVLAREFEAVRTRLRELGSQRIQRQDGSWYWDLKPDWRPGEIVAL
jgi:hypothetical protein